MAKRRMLSQDVVGTDKFIALPKMSQLVYVYLCMWADDDGFIDKTGMVLSALGEGRETLTPLINSGYLYAFSSGVYVILHWPLMNRVKRDRYTPTVYQEEYALLSLSPGGAYRVKETDTAGRFSVSTTNESEKTPPEPDTGDRPLYQNLPLLGGGEYAVTPEQAREYAALYPGVDVCQELRNMRGWLMTHPEKRNTADNVGRFIVNWLMNAKRGAERKNKENGYEKSRGAPKQVYDTPPSFDAALADHLMNTTVPKYKRRYPPCDARAG